MTLDSLEAKYCRKQLDRFHEIWGDRTLEGALRDKLGGVIWDETTVGPALAEAITGALRANEPFSLIRLGDGEGNILGCLDPGLAAVTEWPWFNRTFFIEAGMTLTTEEAYAFARRVEAAALSATILGVRSLVPWMPLGEGSAANLRMSEDCLANGDVRGCLGILRAVDQPMRWAEAGLLAHARLTHAWVYADLLAQLDRITAEAQSILLITGRGGIAEAFAAKYARAGTLRCIEVPIEPMLGRSDRPHYPEVFHEVLEALDTDLRGCLALVGAGTFGKVYCDAVRQSGGVAVDLGSGFDLLAGVKTRPAMHDDDLLNAYRLI